MSMSGSSIDQLDTRTMRHAGEVNRRLRMMDMPHIAPLTQYAQTLRDQFRDSEVPDFDPLDGGVDASVLFLFEKPGPMTVECGRMKRAGSGFISRDNDDLTAAATFYFMRESNIPRAATVIWNIIPAWNGTRRITSVELKMGLSCLTELLALLPRLRSIVLVGRRAERARLVLDGDRYTIVCSAHPSPIVRASRPERWKAIGQEWSKAMPIESD